MSGNAEAIIKTLSIQNPFTQEQVYEGIRRWPKTLDVCLKRANVIIHLKNELNAIHKEDKADKPNTALHLEKITRLSTTLEPLLREATPVELEGYGQVIFQGNPWSSINFIPFALLILSFYKSYIVPAFGVILPLLSWILPYLLLITFYNIPITFSQYMGVLWRMWNGQPMPTTPDDLLNPPPLPQEDAITQIKRLIQNAWTLFTIGQAMWQPIQQGIHFMRLDKEFINIGQSIVEVTIHSKNLYATWGEFFPKWFDSWVSECP